jgi:hypothetical protein
MAKPTNLIGYCGLYCRACGIKQGKIKTAVENLQNTIKAYGFDAFADQLANWEPAFKHHKEFGQVLEAYKKLFGECPNCITGGGDPECKIRPCAKAKGYTTCAECAEIETCQHLEQWRKRPDFNQRIQRIKQVGATKYAEEIENKVKTGYCYLDDKK